VFAVLAGNAFGINPNSLKQFHAINAAAMNEGEQLHFLALINGNPIGTATLSTSDLSASIWNLTTLPEYRKQGVGTALVHTALKEAHKHHYTQVMAILMPKGMAWGLFITLRFEEVCQFPFYVYGASAEELEK
jgi:ribosomal protein S18 acetylase RimI-like enzyme